VPFLLAANREIDARFVHQFPQQVGFDSRAFISPAFVEAIAKGEARTSMPANTDGQQHCFPLRRDDQEEPLATNYRTKQP